MIALRNLRVFVVAINVYALPRVIVFNIIVLCRKIGINIEGS